MAQIDIGTAPNAGDGAELRAAFALVNQTGLRKNSFDATRAPNWTDDLLAGYEVGSRWHFAGRVWECADATTGAAVWATRAVANRSTGVAPGLFPAGCHAHVVGLPASINAMHVRALSTPTGSDVFVYRRTSSHYGKAGAALWSSATNDDGARTFGHREVYEEPDATWEVGPFLSAWCGDQAVILLSRRETLGGGAFNYRAPMMLTSATPAVGPWEATELTLGAGFPASFGALWVGDIYPYPAAAGGDDDAGWVAFCYSNAHIGVITTTDNWLTASTVNVAIPDVGVAVTECGLLGSPTAGYTLLIRVSGDTAMWASFAASPAGPWSVPVRLAHVVNRGSPPEPITLSDNLGYVLQRSARNVLTDLAYDAHLLVAEVDPARIHATAGAEGFGPFEPLAVLGDWAAGYAQTIRRGDQFMILTSGNEATDAAHPNLTHGGESLPILLTATPVASLPARVAQSMRLGPNDNHLVNGDFVMWSGAIEGAPAGRETGPDGWSIGRSSGGGPGHYWRRAAGIDTPWALEIGRLEGEGETQNLHTLNVIHGAALGALRGRMVNLSLAALGGADRTGLLYGFVQSHTAFAKISTTDGSVPGGVNIVNNWLLNLRAGETTYHDLSFNVPDDSEMLVVRFVKTNAGVAGANDWLRLQGVFLADGPVPPLRPGARTHEQAALAVSRLRFQTFDGSPMAAPGAQRVIASGASTLIPMVWPLMVNTPPVGRVYSPVTGALGKARNVTSGADLNAAFVTIGPRGGTVEVNGATAGDVIDLHASVTAEAW